MLFTEMPLGGGYPIEPEKKGDERDGSANDIRGALQNPAGEWACSSLTSCRWLAGPYC